MNEIIEQFKVVFGFDDKPLQDGLKKLQTNLSQTGAKLNNSGLSQPITNLSDDINKINTKPIDNISKSIKDIDTSNLENINKIDNQSINEMSKSLKDIDTLSLKDIENINTSSFDNISKSLNDINLSPLKDIKIDDDKITKDIKNISEELNNLSNNEISIDSKQATKSLKDIENINTSNLENISKSIKDIDTSNLENINKIDNQSINEMSKSLKDIDTLSLKDIENINTSSFDNISKSLNDINLSPLNDVSKSINDINTKPLNEISESINKINDDNLNEVSDALKDVDNNTKNASKSLDDMQEEVKETDNFMSQLAKTAGSLFATMSVFQGIKAITVDYANYNTQLGLNASLIGANVEQLDTLGNALQYFGGNTDSAVSSIKSLNGHLEQAKRGQGALIEVSRKYGISINPYQEPTEALLQMSKQMGRFTTQQRLAISQQLGLDDSITRAFGDPERLAKHIARMKELGASTQEDVKISDNFNDSITYLKQLFNALARDFARVVLPMFTKLLDIFTSFIEWVRKHKQLVVIFFTALAVAMLPVLILFGKIALASAIAFAPLLIAFAKIAVLSLILEDIYGYFMGWDSVTGDLVKKFPVLGMLLEPLRPIVKAISDTFGAIVDWLKDPTFENFGKIFDNVLNIIKEIVIAISVGIYNAIGAIGTAIVELGKSILEWFTKPIDGAVESLKGMFSSAKNFLGFGGDENVPQAPTVPLQASATTQNQANNYNVNNNFNQNISSATPKAFADQTNSQITNSINFQRQNQGAL